jgi:hypothetical protein
MRRAAWVFSVVSVIVLILGIFDYVTNYNWAAGDQNPLFGNQNILLNDGATVLIAGGLLTLGSILMWVVALRQQSRGEGKLQKERGDQHQP